MGLVRGTRFVWLVMVCFVSAHFHRGQYLSVMGAVGTVGLKTLQ